MLPRFFDSGSSPSYQCYSSNSDDIQAARCLARRVLKDSLTKLKKLPDCTDRSIRWELGTCWVQHLQKQETSKAEETKGNLEDTLVEPIVKGLGKQFEPLKKIKKKTDSADCSSEKADPSADTMVSEETTDAGKLRQCKTNGEDELRELLLEEAFRRLKDSGTGLHQKVCRISILLCWDISI